MLTSKVICFSICFRLLHCAIQIRLLAPHCLDIDEFRLARLFFFPFSCSSLCLSSCLFASIVCSQFKNGSITIVSSEKALSNHIQSTTRALDIPQIQTHLDAESGDGNNKEFSINIFPAQSVLNKAMFDVMKFLNWTRCAIIYEQDTGECWQ
jgi:hypothetical protein